MNKTRTIKNHKFAGKVIFKDKKILKIEGLYTDQNNQTNLLRVASPEDQDNLKTILYTIEVGAVL